MQSPTKTTGSPAAPPALKPRHAAEKAAGGRVTVLVAVSAKGGRTRAVVPAREADDLRARFPRPAADEFDADQAAGDPAMLLFLAQAERASLQPTRLLLG